MTGKGARRQRRALATYALLQRAAEAAAAQVEAVMQPHGVSPSQGALLEALAAHGPQHQQELATRLARSKAQLTALAEALEAKGLVHRERHATDRRYVTVTITDAGRALLAVVEPARAQVVADVMGALEPKQRSRLAKACRRLLQALAPEPLAVEEGGAGGGVDPAPIPASAPTAPRPASAP